MKCGGLGIELPSNPKEKKRKTYFHHFTELLTSCTPPQHTRTLVHLHLGFLLSRHAQSRHGGGGARKVRMFWWCAFGPGVSSLAATYVILLDHHLSLHAALTT